MSTSYVKFTDLTTNQTILVGNGTGGWTPIDSDDVEDQLAAGFAQGQATNTPPTLSLPVSDSGVAVQLQAALAAGDALQTEVASYDSGGRLTNDYLITLSAAIDDKVTGGPASVAAGDAPPGDGNNLVHNVALRAGSYTSRTTTYDAMGNPSTTSGGYSFTSKQPITTPAGTAPSMDSSLTGSADVDAHAYGAISTFITLTDQSNHLAASEDQADFAFPASNQYYLPASGQSLSQSQFGGHVFEPGNFAYDLSHGTSGGNLASLSYSALPDVESPLLFQMTVSGTLFKQIEIFQLGSDGAAPSQVVSDTVLTNVAVTGMTFDLGDNGANGRVYTLQAGTGTYTTSHSPMSTNSAPTVKSVSVSAPSSTASGVTVADSATARATDYNLTIQSYDNVATTTAISSALFSVTGGVPGAGPGHGAFSPLTITFDTMPSADVIAALAGTNKTLAIDELKANGTGGSQSYETLTFGAVQPTSGSPTVKDNGDGTFAYTYTFQVGSFQDSYHRPAQNGGSYTSQSAQWSQTKNADGTTTVQQDPACFCRGTRILTARGDVAVEGLRVGDIVVTAAGEHRPVIWLGRQALDCGVRPVDRPVRVRAGAFGPGSPSRDLRLSPGHAVCVDLLGEVLIPAGQLVNGATIVQDQVDSVEYWHVELDRHDVLLAEGMPAESYIDTGNRGFFTVDETLPVGIAAPLDDDRRPPVLDTGTRAVLRARLAARGGGQGQARTRGPHATRPELAARC